MLLGSWPTGSPFLLQRHYQQIRFDRLNKVRRQLTRYCRGRSGLQSGLQLRLPIERIVPAPLPPRRARWNLSPLLAPELIDARASIKRRNDANHIKPLARFGCSKRQRCFQSLQSVAGIIGNENDPAQRFGFRRWFGEKHNRARRFSHKATRDIAEKRMQHHLFSSAPATIMSIFSRASMRKIASAGSPSS